jgi:hypothetical protein
MAVACAELLRFRLVSHLQKVVRLYQERSRSLAIRRFARFPQTLVCPPP